MDGLEVVVGVVRLGRFRYGSKSLRKEGYSPVSKERINYIGAPRSGHHFCIMVFETKPSQALTEKDHFEERGRAGI